MDQKKVKYDKEVGCSILLRKNNVVCSLYMVNMNTDCIKVLPSTSKESHNATSLLHGNTEGSPYLRRPRPKGLNIGDNFKWSYNSGTIERSICSRDFLDKLRDSKLDLREK